MSGRGQQLGGTVYRRFRAGHAGIAGIGRRAISAERTVGLSFATRLGGRFVTLACSDLRLADVCLCGALLIAGRESSTVSFVACSVSVCFSVSVGLIEPACFPVPVFGGLGGN
jgi:hypothetical protein